MIISVILYELESGDTWHKYLTFPPTTIYEDRKKIINDMEAKGDILIYIDERDFELFEKGYTSEDLQIGKQEN